MKLFFFLFMLLFSVNLSAQNKSFQIEAKIVDCRNKPIPDVYVINYRNLDKNISLSNGVVKVTVLPADSLLFDHISYYQKVVKVFDLLVNPVIILIADTINIMEVDVSAQYKTDHERARENLSFLGEYDVPEFSKIKVEEPVSHQLMKEHNKIMRSEAGSISLIRISPSEEIKKIFRKIRKKQKRKKRNE